MCVCFLPVSCLHLVTAFFLYFLSVPLCPLNYFAYLHPSVTLCLRKVFYTVMPILRFLFRVALCFLVLPHLPFCPYNLICLCVNSCYNILLPCILTPLHQTLNGHHWPKIQYYFLKNVNCFSRKLFRRRKPNTWPFPGDCRASLSLLPLSVSLAHSLFFLFLSCTLFLTCIWL